MEHLSGLIHGRLRSLESENYRYFIKISLWPGALKDFDYNNEIDNKFDNDVIRDEIAIDEIFENEMIQIDQKYDKLLALVRFFR